MLPGATSSTGAAVKRTRALFRVAAVASSVLLVVGFVAYSAGALDRVRVPVMFSSSKSSPVFVPDQQPQTGPQDPTPLMGGSKSKVVLPPSALQPPTQAPSGPQPSPPAPAARPQP